MVVRILGFPVHFPHYSPTLHGPLPLHPVWLWLPDCPGPVSTTAGNWPAAFRSTGSSDLWMYFTVMQPPYLAILHLVPAAHQIKSTEFGCVAETSVPTHLASSVVLNCRPVGNSHPDFDAQKGFKEYRGKQSPFHCHLPL